MSRSRPPHGSIEFAFVAVSILTLAAIVFSNVIRVGISERAASTTWMASSAVAWLCAIGWAASTRHRASIVWLATTLAAGILIAICQSAAGSVSLMMMFQLLGSTGAGLGLALLLKSSLKSDRPPLIATVAALCGSVAAIWMALEPGLELWKLLPNNWEISKNLEYRWGIRSGQDRARFLFDSPMEAGVVQWLLGTVCLASALSRRLPASRSWILGTAALLLYGSVALTYSRAGIALAILSLGIAGLCSIRSTRATVLTGLTVGSTAVAIVIALGILGAIDSAGVKNVTSIFDPSEEANRIRIQQFAETGSALAETPWHGSGPHTYITFKQAPRIPEHESFPVGLVTAFGFGGGVLFSVFAWLVISRMRRLADVVLNKRFIDCRAAGLLTVMTVLPFSAYSLVAPILASLVFGLVWFTAMGLLVLWESTLEQATGKP